MGFSSFHSAITEYMIISPDNFVKNRILIILYAKVFKKYILQCLSLFNL